MDRCTTLRVVFVELGKLTMTEALIAVCADDSHGVIETLIVWLLLGYGCWLCAVCFDSGEDT